MFKDKLCKLMDERSISAYKLSKETGIPQSGISQYRSGKVVPGLDKAQIIADYFGVSVDFLLSADDEKKPPAEAEGEMPPYMVSVLKAADSVPADKREDFPLLAPNKKPCENKAFLLFC